MTVNLSVPGGADVVARLTQDNIRSWMGPADGGWRILVEGVPVLTIVTADGPFQLADGSSSELVMTDPTGHEWYRGDNLDDLTAAVRAAWASETTTGTVSMPRPVSFRLVAFPDRYSETCPCGAPVMTWRQGDADGDSESYSMCLNRGCNRSNS